MDLPFSIRWTEGSEFPDEGAISFKELHQRATSLTLSADYLPGAITIYISRSYLHLTVGVGSPPEDDKGPDTGTILFIQLYLVSPVIAGSYRYLPVGISIKVPYLRSASNPLLEVRKDESEKHYLCTA